MFKSAPASLALQLVLLSLIGIASGFPIPDFTDTNWDIALFLTPYGIAYNHLHPNILTTFYSDISSGQTDLTTQNSAVMTVLYILAFLNAVYTIRRLNQSSKGA